MPRYVQIGDEIINLDAVTHAVLVSRNGGLERRVVLSMGSITLEIHSNVPRVWERLRAALKPEIWYEPEDESPRASAPAGGGAG